MNLHPIRRRRDEAWRDGYHAGHLAGYAEGVGAGSAEGYRAGWNAAMAILPVVGDQGPEFVQPTAANGYPPWPHPATAECGDVTNAEGQVAVPASELARQIERGVALAAVPVGQSGSHPRVCTGTTLAGTPCRLSASPGRDTCHHHQGH